MSKPVKDKNESYNLSIQKLQVLLFLTRGTTDSCSCAIAGR